MASQSQSTAGQFLAVSAALNNGINSINKHAIQRAADDIKGKNIKGILELLAVCRQFIISCLCIDEFCKYTPKFGHFLYK
jgi:hypothetical protein